MLRSPKQVFGKKVVATDGPVGHVQDLLFDEHDWVIRYIAVDTAGWTSDRLVLVSPDQFVEVDGSFTLERTKNEIRQAPPVETAIPRIGGNISAADVAAYWGGGVWMAGMAVSLPDQFTTQPPAAGGQGWDVRQGEHPIHSVKETRGYRAESESGDVGRVEDLLIDEGWLVRYVVIDTTIWMSGGFVPVPTRSIPDVDWQAMVVKVALSKDVLRGAPEYRPSEDFSRADEERLLQHLGHERYWGA